MTPESMSALAEPNRFRIVELLRGGPRPVNDIVGRLKMDQPQVSKHLKVLKDRGWLEVEPRAQQRLYRLRAEPLLDLREWLERYRRIWEERHQQLDGVLGELIETEKSNERRKKG